MVVAVSACLLGEKVRFDSGHKKDTFVTQHLANYAEFVPFCPENLAFSNPRPSVRLVQEEKQVKVESNKTQEDLTQKLQDSSVAELEKLKEAPLCGIVFKSRSPSCGLGSAKLYHTSGMSIGKEDGVFAKLCKEHFPLLPHDDHPK